MIDASAVARVVGISEKFQDLRGGAIQYLPQRIAVIAQGATASTYSTTKKRVSSGKEVGDTFGYGSLLHLIVDALLPTNGDGVGSIPVTVFPLNDAGAATTAAGDITPSGTAVETVTYWLRAGGVLSEPFTVTKGAIVVADVIDAMVAAGNAVLKFPLILSNNADTNLAATAKWAGATGNDIKLEVLGGEGNGVTFAITQPTGGATNPDVQTALDQIGDVWETLIINGLDIADTTTLDKYTTWGEGRWTQPLPRPAIVFTGVTIAALASAYAVSDARKTDRVNAQLTDPGSPNLPQVVAARQLVRIAKLAQNNPPHDYGSQKATELIPGTDAEQWNWTQRDAAVKAGSSTVIFKDGVVEISDVVTFYHPTGENPPAYRYVVDIIKLMQIMYNLQLEFASDKWDGKPLVPDDQPVTNPEARKPKNAKGAAGLIIDSLGDAAIISDPSAAKKTLTATINAQNPKRLDLTGTLQLSGNVNIIDIPFNWGFYFGGIAAAA